jgi:hypothetical protein
MTPWILQHFLNPAFFWTGMALLSLPVIIHLINRLRYRRVRFAAMEFLLASQKRNRRRILLEQLLLLMMRIAVVLLVVVAVGGGSTLDFAKAVAALARESGAREIVGVRLPPGTGLSGPALALRRVDDRLACGGEPVGLTRLRPSAEPLGGVESVFG